MEKCIEYRWTSGHSCPASLQGNSSRLELSSAWPLEVSQGPQLSSALTVLYCCTPRQHRGFCALRGPWRHLKLRELSSGLRKDPPLLSMDCVASLSLGFFVCEMGLTSPIEGKQRSVCVCVYVCHLTLHLAQSGSLTKRNMLLLGFGCHCYGSSMVGCVPQGARLLPSLQPPWWIRGQESTESGSPWAPRET